jgi:hypothetical protein
MAQQYLRRFSCVVADPAGKGLDLGGLRCVFNVRRGDTQTPNGTDVRIYNLSPNTEDLIAGPDREFTQLRLSAGYGDDLQLIFKGSIKQARRGREDQRNSYVDITAADGDEAYNYSSVALTLAAGAVSPKNIIESIVQIMARQVRSTPTGGTGGEPTTLGYLPQMPATVGTRGRVYYGMCRDVLRDIAEANNCKWSIQDGQVVFVPWTGYIDGEPVLISPGTGLIGVPEQTQNGLTLRVLLNPAIKIGQRIKLDSKNINQFRYSLDYQTASLNDNLALSSTKLSSDGSYYVMRADHEGDTRGEQWYTELTCLSVDASVPLDANQQAAIFPTSGPIAPY